MTYEKSLATILNQFMDASGMGDSRLATLVNRDANISGFLHRSTIRNWRIGASKSVKDWRQLTAIAAVLNLSQDETDQLLFAGGCLPIHVLQTMASDEDQSFLAYWQTDKVTTHTSRPPEQTQTSSLAADPSPQKRTSLRLPQIVFPLLFIAGVIFGLLYGLIIWRNAEETTSSHIIFSEPTEPSWDFATLSWDWTAEPIETEMAIDGRYALNVSLAEYGGLTFFTPDPIETKPHHILQFYIRNADSTQTDPQINLTTLQIIIDDDDLFSNGEVGRMMLEPYMDREITADQWYHVEIPLDAFSSERFAVSQLAIHTPNIDQTPHFWLDQIQLTDRD